MRARWNVNPQIHNGQVTWQGRDGNDDEIFIYKPHFLWEFNGDWFTTIQNGITSIMTLVQDVIGRLDNILAKLNSNLDVPVSSRASQTSVEDLDDRITELESSVKKLDLQVHQHPTPKRTFYHIGASLEGLPVDVELDTVFARVIDATNKVYSWEDVTQYTRSFSFAPGHLRVQFNLPEELDAIFFQIIIRHDDDGIMRYGTYLTPNENSKYWTKDMGK